MITIDNNNANEWLPKILIMLAVTTGTKENEPLNDENNDSN